MTRPLPAGALLGWGGAAAATVSAVTLAVAWAGGGGDLVDVPWAPDLGVRLHLRLDGLGALYGVLAAGVGALVFAYATAYLPRHLEHRHRPAHERSWWNVRFWGWMVLFLGTMIGLALVQDVLLLFVLFDITAVCSFFLIGFDGDDEESRSSALMAMLVTAGTAVALLVAAAMLQNTYGTLSVPELATRTEAGPTLTVIAALVLVAALTKSAQAPLHMWLPRAMAAPTPVSAYLHSAAMVAAGVLVIGRLYPVLAPAAGFRELLVVVGALSIAVGGVLSLAATRLKRILAYSTISQYGYVVVLYGIGGEAGAGAATFYVVAHALAKAALFLAAGAVTEATGADTIDEVGGLARRRPVLAVVTGIAAANLAALPLTIGFFKDELFFKAALEAGGPAPVLATVAAALTLAYIGRFWLGVFTGPEADGQADHPIPARLVWPVGVFAATAVLFGAWVAPVTRLAEDAAESSLATAVTLEPAYHLDLRAENVMALSAWAAGALVLAAPRLWRPAVAAAAALGSRAGPERVYGVTISAVARAAEAIHRVEVRDLRNSFAAVLVPGALLILFSVAASRRLGRVLVGDVRGEDVVLLGILALVAVSSLAVVLVRRHLALVLALSVLGYGLAAVYALMGAPAVALVAVIVETALTVILVAALSRLPVARPHDVDEHRRIRGRRWRDPAIAGISGVAAFALVWSFLSRPSADTRVSDELIALSPEAGGDNVVTMILIDFRGLDTLGEITVLVLALAGVAGLLRAGRLW